MADPKFATDLRDDLMGLSLDANEAAAVVIYMRDGNVYSRRADDVTDADLIRWLRKQADEMEQE